MGLQVFLINPDGTTTELTSDGAVKDILKTDECYVIVADDIRKVFLWKGIASSVRSKFIGAKRSQEIRGQVGMHYAVVPLDESEETDDFLNLIGGKTEAGIAKEIKEEKAAAGAPAGGSAGGGHPLREKPIFDPPEPAQGMNIAGSTQRMGQNTGPLYTGKESMQSYTQEEPTIKFDQIIQKLDEIQIPDGYERELIIIGNHAYSVVEKVTTFLGEKQIEKKIEEVGSIPEGVFFAEGYSPRVLSENGKVVAIEFLKASKSAGGKKPVEYKDKKQILKDQIKIQLGNKK
ncbi:MAG: hypothetical protein EU529_11540 [Promethearchaeota archaeon]|nr:MAG: hypothetical protein EU529_11540 [Candidatus Lokiarchaeota archaeon]